MKLKLAIKEAFNELKKSNIKSALLDSEILISQAINKNREFISLMLMSGQIKLLKEASKILNLEYSELYNKTEDRYFH